MTALCVPAREVGGDYYDFFPLPGDRARRADRRRVGQGHVRGALHGGAEGADAVAQPDLHSPRAAADRGQPDHLREPRQPQLHHDDLRASSISQARRDDVLPRRPHAAHLPAAAPAPAAPPRRCSRRAAWWSACASTGAARSSPSCSRRSASTCAGRRHRALHRRHHRGDERRAAICSARRGSAGSSRSTATSSPASCASGSCARSRRSSATPISTTT